MHATTLSALIPVLCAGPPSAILRTSIDYSGWLARLIFPCKADYYSGFGALPESLPISLSGYLAGEPGPVRGACSELPLPDAFHDDIWLGSRDPVFSGEALAIVHAGRAGCFAPLHFDWDQRWVWHVVPHGKKEFLFADPDAGWLLSPVINTAALNVPALSERDLATIAPTIGLERIVVREGESVLFPSTIWHGVRYSEPCVGLSIRFEQHPGGRPFGVLPRSWWLQRLAWRFHRAGYEEPAAAVFRRLAECFFEPEPDWRRRWQKMQTAYRRELAALGAANGVDSWVGDNFSAELALAGDELAVGYTVDEAANEPAAPAIEDTVQYLFEGLDWSLPPELRRRLAVHALRTRTGLRPRRGLLKIRAEGWEKHEEA